MDQACPVSQGQTYARTTRSTTFTDQHPPNTTTFTDQHHQIPQHSLTNSYQIPRHSHDTSRLWKHGLHKHNFKVMTLTLPQAAKVTAVPAVAVPVPVVGVVGRGGRVPSPVTFSGHLGLPGPQPRSAGPPPSSPPPLGLVSLRQGLGALLAEVSATFTAFVSCWSASCECAFPSGALLDGVGPFSASHTPIYCDVSFWTCRVLFLLSTDTCSSGCSKQSCLFSVLTVYVFTYLFWLGENYTFLAKSCSHFLVSISYLRKKITMNTAWWSCSELFNTKQSTSNAASK